MASRRKYLIGSIALAALLLTLAGIGFGVAILRNLSKVLAWEEVHTILYAWHDALERGAVASEWKDHAETPLDLSHVAIPNFAWSRSEMPYRDRWGTPMQFYFICVDGKYYGKGISAGRDRIFDTPDDIIDSEFDNSGTVFAPRNLRD